MKQIEEQVDSAQRVNKRKGLFADKGGTIEVDVVTLSV